MFEKFSKGQLPNQGFHITTILEQNLCIGGKCPVADLCERRGTAYMSRRCKSEIAKVSALSNNSKR